MKDRPRRIPLFRIGLLLVVGSVAASIFRFYLGVGADLADMSGEGVSTQPRDLARYFVNDFLFAGTAAGLLFWGGLLLCMLGAGRMLAGGPRRPKGEVQRGAARRR